MILISKLKYKLDQDGVGGVAVSALRHIANQIEFRTRKVSRRTQSDEFLMWLRFAVPGMMTPGNIAAMKYAVKNMPAGSSILEIGSFCGLSTCILSYMLDKYSRTSPMFTCDKWQFEGQNLGAPLGDSPTVTHDSYRAYVKNSFLHTMRTFASNRLPYTVECFSDEFFELWFGKEEATDVFGRPVPLGGKLGFCYIDGNHTYDFAKRDFENSDRAMVPGGLILFDDSADGSGWEVNTLTREIASGSSYKLISKNPNYLFQKR